MSNGVLCDGCGKKFNFEDEGDVVETAGGYKNYCDICCDDYIWVCPICDDNIHIDFHGCIGSTIVVNDVGNDIDQPDGIYEILRHPYWRSDYLTSSLINHSLKRIGDIPQAIRGYLESGYPVEHICQTCGIDVKRSAILKRRYR